MVGKNDTRKPEAIMRLRMCGSTLMRGTGTCGGKWGNDGWVGRRKVHARATRESDARSPGLMQVRYRAPLSAGITQMGSLVSGRWR